MIVALVDPESLVAPEATLLLDEDFSGGAGEAGGAGGDEADDLCPMTSEGPDTADSDGDNYPVNDTRTFDCEIISESPLVPFSFAGRGSLVLTDDDDTDPASGVSVEASSIYTASVGGVAQFSVGVQVMLDAAVSSSGTGYVVDLEGSGTIEDPGSRRDLTNNYDAELVGSFGMGTMTVDGMFDIAVQPRDCTQVDESMRAACEMAIQEVEAVEINLEVTSAGLGYDAVACPTVFTGGSFKVSGDGNTITVSYSACGQRTVTLPATPVTPAPVPPAPVPPAGG